MEGVGKHSHSLENFVFKGKKRKVGNVGVGAVGMLVNFIIDSPENEVLICGIC